MGSLEDERDEDFTLEHPPGGMTAFLRDRATPYTARVSAWWLEVTQREGCQPMSHYDQ
jgi:hypothetical protein